MPEKKGCVATFFRKRSTCRHHYPFPNSEKTLVGASSDTSIYLVALLALLQHFPVISPHPTQPTWQLPPKVAPTLPHLAVSLGQEQLIYKVMPALGSGEANLTHQHVNSKCC